MKSTGRFNAELRALQSSSYNECRSCGSKLPENIAAYAGYASDKSARYVGACCLHEIEELSTHVYWWWEADKRVYPDTLLWRYMDLAKFLQLLEGKSLYFSRADKFEDPFEGATGLAVREQEWDSFYLDYFRRVIQSPPPGSTGAPLSEDKIEQNAQQLLASIRASAVQDRQSTFVSCWHANSGESEALWRLYCPVGSSGVVIKTTASRLMRSVDPSASVNLGSVQYVDFRNSFAGFHDRIFWKRKSLSHEREVRAVIRQRQIDDRLGLAVPVNINELIDVVIPSPFAPAWFPALLSSLVVRFDLPLVVEESELLAQPFF